MTFNEYWRVIYENAHRLTVSQAYALGKYYWGQGLAIEEVLAELKGEQK